MLELKFPVKKPRPPFAEIWGFLGISYEDIFFWNMMLPSLTECTHDIK
jgi:hypothetical protein